MKTKIDYRKEWLYSLRPGDMVYWVDPTNVDTGTYMIDDIYYPEETDIENADFYLICENDVMQFTAIGSEIYPKE